MIESIKISIFSEIRDNDQLKNPTALYIVTLNESNCKGVVFGGEFDFIVERFIKNLLCLYFKVTRRR